jgi:hypothetical protein
MGDTRQLHELAHMMVTKPRGSRAGANNLLGDYAMLEVLDNGTISIFMYTPKRKPKRDGVFIYDPSKPPKEWHRRLTSPGWLELAVFA